MKRSAKMTVVCNNFSTMAVWQKMLNLIYDSSTFMICICNDQMMAFIMLPLRRGLALKNIVLALKNIVLVI